MRLLLADIQKKRNKVIETPPSPKIAIKTWREMVESVRIYGENPDAEIPGLHGPRLHAPHWGFFKQTLSWCHWRTEIDARHWSLWANKSSS